MEKCNKNCNYLINCFYQDEAPASWEDDEFAGEFDRIKVNPVRYS
jgi:hypothetical protein